MQFRTGIGYDLHRTGAARALRLGGVEIPAESGLIGHSDADVVLHAVVDALLGAAGIGDIGDLFPDTDERYRDMDSRVFVEEAVRRTRAGGWACENCDIIVHAERPKLAAHKPAIAARVAELLGIDRDRVCVKATTNERLGPIGRGEAIACWAAVLLSREAAPAVG
ncbi:MAG: 2-C-methyl-D-erythritol 2,4-cyclodiphosphate synthase [Phycisphaerales bacterium]|nr:2-C-methyl-D-erythritol 2,4-cyclodiphosphate synthase [Phycisphaerales bacterium]